MAKAPAGSLDVRIQYAFTFFYLYFMFWLFFVLLMVSCRDVHHIMNMERRRETIYQPFLVPATKYNIPCAPNTMCTVQFKTNEQIHCSREIWFTLYIKYNKAVKQIQYLAATKRFLSTKCTPLLTAAILAARWRKLVFGNFQKRFKISGLVSMHVQFT